MNLSTEKKIMDLNRIVVAKAGEGSGMDWELGVNRCRLLPLEWIRMWYMFTMEYYSAIKKNEIMPFAAKWMQVEILILSEVRKRKANTI